ncbi:hypothetical protein NOJ05_19670 [Neorhizobium galegae]|uniref:hypothetical protein n=1 Tax=Neorhizobium galegae TaxID=399 RepID=UPI00210404CA|nr:hypothetical protein [Neorhizobium galegae]MCQ1779431.1 hypothetical protein [Neorhizobium galegae]MCQ1795591.1 hypothetical protein [Neorhizobium galegae]
MVDPDGLQKLNRARVASFLPYERFELSGDRKASAMKLVRFMERSSLRIVLGVSMTSKDLIVVGPEDKEIARFLRAVVDAGSVTVELGSQRIQVTATLENISSKGRRAVVRGPDLGD